MELKEFIKQSIIQIAEGIREGHDYIQRNDLGNGVEDTYQKEVSFDVAVISNEESKTGIEGKLSVASVFKLGAADENKNVATNSSRIQFKINMHVKTRV
jgi:hypothetical protein